jgi:protoheme IX farnesyltransferase
LFRDYYQLTKPGIVYGNLLTALAGYLLVTNVHLSWLKFALAMLGFCLIVAAACVTNNYIDRQIDSQMKRTQNRALVTGKITGRQALSFAFLLGITGCLTVGWSAGHLAVLIEIVGYVLYVIVYGVAKRRTAFGTLIGSLSGAVPPLAGYAALHHSLNAAAWSLFLVVALWQMPHFYGIALYRFSDYKKVKLPVWPVIYGKQATKIQTMLYLVAYTFAIILLTHYAALGILFAIVLSVANLAWLYHGLHIWKLPPVQWGRQMFLRSLLAITLLSVYIMTLGVLHSVHLVSCIGR